MTDVSLVITSCGRLDLLERTIASFEAHNTYPVARSILIEDSNDRDVYARVEQNFGHLFDRILYNDPKLGQIASIDKAYAEVDTPYIFHCEDDWAFFRSGFIEDSLAVLAEDEHIITVWLRDLWDTNRHRIERPIRHTRSGVMFRDVAVEDDKQWHGFTFNPGLRRLADYERVKPFADIGHEYEINVRYWELGYYAAILEQGATEHLGKRRSERKKELAGNTRLKHRLKRLVGRR